MSESELKIPLKDTEHAEGNHELINKRKMVYAAINQNEKPDTWANRWTVWKKIYPITTLMWWCYVVT